MVDHQVVMTMSGGASGDGDKVVMRVVKMK
jgi:hypothetical protein